MVQIYPWFKFSFLLFQSHYHTLPCPKTKENKCKPRIKLNHNIYIHKKLCLKSHINLSVAKIAKSVGIIYRSRYLWQPAPLSLYYTLIYPYMRDFDIVWSSTYNTHLNRIYLLQKGAIRAFTN